MEEDIQAYLDWKNEIERCGMTISGWIKTCRDAGMREYADELETFIWKMEDRLQAQG